MCHDRKHSLLQVYVYRVYITLAYNSYTVYAKGVNKQDLECSYLLYTYAHVNNNAHTTYVHKCSLCVISL